MAFFRLRTTAALLAAAGLGLTGLSWAQGTPPAVAPPATSITSPNTAPAGSGNAGNTNASGASSSGNSGASMGGAAGTAPAQGGTRSAGSAASTKPAHADASFMNDAAQAGHFEVEAAKMALQKGQSDAVKGFAQKMIDDHTAAAQQLESLASSKNHKLPDGPSMVQKGKLKLLSTHEGAKFDKSYIDSLGPKAHRETIALFEKGGSKAHDPDVKAYAEKTLPTLREHLQMAEQLDQSLNGKNSKNATHDAPMHSSTSNANNKK